MRGLCLVVVATIGCHGSEPAPVTPKAPAPAAPDVPVDEPDAPGPSRDAGAAAPEPSASDDCVATCVERRQMQAVAAEVIARECARTCEAQSEPVPQ